MLIIIEPLAVLQLQFLLFIVEDPVYTAPLVMELKQK